MNKEAYTKGYLRGLQLVKQAEEEGLQKYLDLSHYEESDSAAKESAKRQIRSALEALRDKKYLTEEGQEELNLKTPRILHDKMYNIPVGTLTGDNAFDLWRAKWGNTSRTGLIAKYNNNTATIGATKEPGDGFETPKIRFRKLLNGKFRKVIPFNYHKPTGKYTSLASLGPKDDPNPEWADENLLDMEALPKDFKLD